MYYQDAHLDMDLLLLLAGAALLIASIMYNMPAPRLISEGLRGVYILGAFAHNGSTQLTVFSPAHIFLRATDLNKTLEIPKGIHDITLPVSGPVKICVELNGAEECGEIYPVPP